MKTTFFFLLLATSAVSYSQSIDKLITIKEVERIERTLSADDMQGRKAGTSGIEKAADFISAEFKKIGLQTMGGLKDYKQTFSVISLKALTASGKLDNEIIDPKNIIVATSSAKVDVDEKALYEKVILKETKGQSFLSEAAKYLQMKKNLLVLVDTMYSRNFPRLQFLARETIKSNNTVIFVLSPVDPSTYSINTTQQISEIPYANVVGVLPGKSKKAEQVIFSSHHDHLGVGKPVNGDSIYNGANDDAAGSTAVIMLAKYYKALKNNNRTLVFVTFTAEESGGYGSQYFSGKMPAEKVAAMFNLEMIGTESKWGKGSAYITGYEKTDMGKILEKNLQKTSFKFYPDPYPAQNLFYRSDNARLARMGVPAHTISTAQMDAEPHYHKVSDEIGTLDLQNMTEIIKAIAKSSKTIVDGTDTPTRVDSRN
jgi:hypothetical protein